MNFLELAKRLRQETGTAGTGPATVVGQQNEYGQLIAWVKTAYLDVQNLWHDWQFLWKESTVATASGTDTYTLAADMRTLQEDSLYVDDGSGVLSPMTYVQYDDYRRNRPSNSLPGTPSAFTVLPNNKIRLLPTPDDIYTLSYEYYRSPHTLVADTDQPLIPDAYHEAVLWKAKMYWADFQDAPAELANANVFFQMVLVTLEADQLPAKDKAHARSEGVDIVVVPC